jgi:two-component system LytT family sensor kinase
MRTLKLTILFFIICSDIFSVTLATLPLSKGISIKNPSKTATDTAEVNRYTRKALSFLTKPLKQNIDNIKANIDSAESICEKENIEIPALLHLARAEYFFMTGDFNNSSVEAAIAQKLSKGNKEMGVLARTMNFFGRYSLRTGFFKESIDYFKNSIVIAKENQIKGLITRNYSSLAEVYNNLRDTVNLRSSLKLLIEAAGKENDTLFLINGSYRLGSSLTSPVRNFKQADSLLKKSLELSLIIKDTAAISSSLANMGWNYYIEKKFKIAIDYYIKSLTYSVPGKIFSASANSLGNLGTIYRDLGETEKSIKYYQKSIEQAKLDNDIYDLSWVHMEMSDMFLSKKDTANAYKNYVLFKKYSDILITKSNSQGLNDARIKYDADKHNKELELLSLRIRNQKLLIYGYTGLFVLSLAIGVLILSRSKINSKRRISEMNRKIAEVTQANLRQQMNPHFIFNTLNSIQYYMYQHDKLATNNYLTKFSSLMRKVLENSQHTSIPLRDELDALNLYLELEMIRFKDKFDYKINVDEEIDTIMYKVPTMLIQPYVENSICHGLMPGEGKGFIKIDLKLENDFISCIIEDNGIGREAAQEKKRKVESNHNSLSTQIISSRLDLVNALYGTSLKTIYTDLKNSDGESEGTRVEIQIPIMS